MGLFSFLKSSGPKLLTKQEEDSIKNKSSEEALNVRKEAIVRKINDINQPVHNISVDINGETVTVYGQADTQIAKELAILTAGNNEGISSVDDRMSVVKPEPESQFYEVKSGDTLSKIAKAQYGDAMEFNTIFEANKPMLKDPDKIYPGQVLRIPRR